MKHTLKRFFKHVWETIQEAQMARARAMLKQRTIRELRSLTDKELYDIGISRGEIYDVATEISKPKANDNLKDWA